MINPTSAGLGATAGAVPIRFPPPAPLPPCFCFPTARSKWEPPVGAAHRLPYHPSHVDHHNLHPSSASKERARAIQRRQRRHCLLTGYRAQSGGDGAMKSVLTDAGAWSGVNCTAAS
ncbi:MAG: hypothetical protein BJ554DRAFT_5604 [Olpidium bornovanus]|uniref:Uncharacterized protein n=1 Tax=Olpidium bornovanus TaxID=278681 RepID=A0A8H7ZZA7_9FUNG|nr:MAG: hypothetical protein BJ554DRAFT_5604 [Olpidium bornovanus]